MSSSVPNRQTSSNPDWKSRLTRSRNRESALVGAIALIFYFIGSWIPSYSNDESITATSVDRTFSEVLRIFPNDAALEPYYLGLNLWAHVSTSPLWLRLPSVIAMALAVAFLYRLTSALVDRRLGAMSAAAMLIIPATTEYAHEIRPYAIGIAASVAAVLAWHFFVTGSSRWTGFWYAVSVVVASLMHAYTLLVVGALFVTAIACYRDKLALVLKRTLVPPILALVVLSPYLIYVSKHARGAPSRREFGIDGIVQTALVTGVGRQFSALASLTSALLLFIALLGFVMVLLTRNRDLRVAAVLGFMWAAVFPVALILLQVATGAPGLVARYWSFALPGIAIGIGLALRWLITRFNVVVAVVGAVILALIALPTQVELRTQDGHFGLRWTLLPQVVNIPALQQYPLVLPAWLYESTLANANGQIPTSRFPFWEDLKPEGRVYQHELSATDPRIVVLQSQVPGVILYSYEGAPKAKPPTAAAFEVPEQKALIRKFPELAVSCSYFGDALAVFVKPSDPMTDPQAVAKQIEDVSPPNISCIAGG